MLNPSEPARRFSRCQLICEWLGCLPWQSTLTQGDTLKNWQRLRGYGKGSVSDRESRMREFVVVDRCPCACRLRHNAGRPVTTRPEWRSAAIEGIAPLMSPREVEAALNHRGYVQVPCPTNGKLLDRPLYVGDERSCYRAPTARMAVSLYFLDSRRDGGWRW
jgi:hypothetical protein